MKVLISEDQTQLQTLMKLMMRKWGYEADIASNGLEAFNLAKENQYDVCIMDLKMPIMDGYEAIKKIRNELPFLPNKMSHKLIGEGKELFEFLDRGDNPANCHLYKCNMQTNRLLLTPEEFENRLITENSDIEKYTTISDQKCSEDE